MFVKILVHTCGVNFGCALCLLSKKNDSIRRLTHSFCFRCFNTTYLLCVLSEFEQKKLK